MRNDSRARPKFVGKFVLNIFTVSGSKYIVTTVACEISVFKEILLEELDSICNTFLLGFVVCVLYQALFDFDADAARTEYLCRRAHYAAVARS